MHLSPSILGATAVAHLQKTARAAVVEIGSDTLTRADLARVGCFNFVGARILSAVLLPLKVKSLRQVYDEVPPSALALPRLGVVSLAVLGAAFEAKGIGDLESYVRKHAAVRANGSEAQLTTWHTMKQHELAEVARERADRKAATRRRKGKAHALRVGRFEARQGAAS